MVWSPVRVEVTILVVIDRLANSLRALVELVLILGRDYLLIGSDFLFKISHIWI
jgi:hypothetical protein